jgi:hypothetical protein
MKHTVPLLVMLIDIKNTSLLSHFRIHRNTNFRRKSKETKYNINSFGNELHRYSIADGMR